MKSSKQRCSLLPAIAIAMVLVVPIQAQRGKPPKPAPMPATVTFRCLAAEPASPLCNEPVTGTDRVLGDGAGSYSGFIDPSGLFNSQLSTPESGRLLNMYFGSSIPGSRTCIAIGNCHPNGPSDGKHLELNNAEVRVKPLVDGLPWADHPGLLFGMACNSRYPALVHYTFWLPDGDGHWGFNFNPREYPDTTAAVIIRLDNDTWTVEAESDDIGELLSWAHSGIHGKNGPSREGRFLMPFKFTIDGTGPLPAGAVTCTP
jgi:hypothetical protein